MWKFFLCFLLLQNSDLENIVKDLLDGADLEKVTMKSVCKQVSGVTYEYCMCGDKDFHQVNGSHPLCQRLKLSAHTKHTLGYYWFM